NRNVPLRHAFAGGVLAALLFETAKRGFALYVTQFPTYEAIYGAMAAIPIFLIWIWLSWLVTLLGAEFTYCLGIYRHNWREKFYSRGASFLLAFRLIGYLREVQQEGGQLSTAELTEREPEAGEERIEAALKALQAAHLVLRSEDRGWALARDLRETSLLELYHADHFVLPTAGDVETESPRLAELLASLDQDLISKLQQPLDDLYA
ncbi:ribonuclease BN, partial [Candidatus Endoriftia persephone str. Guaymas]|nr:ribonuclease BN [Candidatus Endoriftia persephone str. Guaymas]